MLVKAALLILFGFQTSVFAQSEQGVYLSVNDFNIGKISYGKIPTKKYTIQIHEVLKSDILKIISGDTVISLYKDSIFGYKDQENRIFRFYNKTTYEIINPSENILLYRQSSLGGYKGSQTILNYYFSVNASSSIYPLTVWNLKIAFPTESSFHELLDMYFQSDNDLLRFDAFYHQYKINRVYEFSHEFTPTNK